MHLNRLYARPAFIRTQTYTYSLRMRRKNLIKGGPDVKGFMPCDRGILPCETYFQWDAILKICFTGQNSPITWHESLYIWTTYKGEKPAHACYFRTLFLLRNRRNCFPLSYKGPFR